MLVQGLGALAHVIAPTVIATQPEQRHDVGFVVVVSKKHVHVFAQQKILSQLVVPPNAVVFVYFVSEWGRLFLFVIVIIVTLGFVVVVFYSNVRVHHDAIVGRFANGTFGIRMEIPQPGVTKPSHVVVAARSNAPMTNQVVAATNQTTGVGT